MQDIGTGCCPAEHERQPYHSPSAHGRQPSHCCTGQCCIPVGLGFFTGVESMEDCIVVNGRALVALHGNIATGAIPRACHNPRTGSTADSPCNHKDCLWTWGACRCLWHALRPALDLVTGATPCCCRPVQPPLRHVAGIGRHRQTRAHRWQGRLWRSCGSGGTGGAAGVGCCRRWLRQCCWCHGRAPCCFAWCRGCAPCCFAWCQLPAGAPPGGHESGCKGRGEGCNGKHFHFHGNHGQDLKWHGCGCAAGPRRAHLTRAPGSSPAS